MVIFNKSVYSRSCNPRRTYRCITYYTRLLSDKIKPNQNYTLVMGKVGCLVNMATIIVGLLGGSFMKVDIAGAVMKKRCT